MAKFKYKRLKAPEEFDRWIEERRRNMEKIAKIKITKSKAMRLISKTGGVTLTESMIEYLKDKIR